MSGDGQPIELLDHETRVLADAGGQLRRCPILIREGGGFVGFTGFVGTETIGSSATRDWLARFGEQQADLGLAAYAESLGDALTEAWRELGLVSILEILVSGIEDGEVRFWFVRNSNGLHDGDWTYRAPLTEFVVVDDLDGNYMPRDLRPGQSKEELLRSRMYSFRQGVLLPAAQVFEAFSDILQTIYTQPVDGFEPSLRIQRDEKGRRVAAGGPGRLDLARRHPRPGRIPIRHHDVELLAGDRRLEREPRAGGALGAAAAREEGHPEQREQSHEGQSAGVDHHAVHVGNGRATRVARKLRALARGRNDMPA